MGTETDIQGCFFKVQHNVKQGKIRSEKGEVTADTAEIQRVIRDFYKQLYANEMDNLEEMNKVLEMYNQRLNQEETENMNKPITSHEIETVM